MPNKGSAHRLLVQLVALGVLVLLLIGWERTASVSTSVQFFFSSPGQILEALGSGFVSGASIADLGVSAAATIAGLAIGIVAGCAVGVVALALPPARSLLQGVIATLAALPILAIAPMFLLWFGTGLALKIALAAILAGVVIAARTATSDNAISPELTEFLDANSISSATRTRKVTFPASLEWTLVAIPSAANAAFLGVFIGEFVAADKGIGYRILRAGALYQVDVVLANTLLALIMLLVIQWAVGLFRYQVGAAARYASLDPIHRHSG